MTPDVPNPPAGNALDRFIRQFNYTAYVVAILFLYAVAATALGAALAPALFVFQELGPVGDTWPALWRLAWLGTSLGLCFFVFGFALLLVVPVYNFALPTRVKPFKGGYFTIAAVPFYLHNGLFYLVRYTVLPFFTLTPFGLLFLKAMGNVEVGAGAVVLPHYVVLPGSRVGAGETWGGSITGQDLLRS